jgi:hypothetical protein
MYVTLHSNYATSQKVHRILRIVVLHLWFILYQYFFLTLKDFYFATLILLL